MSRLITGCIVLWLLSGMAMATEEPQHTVVREEGPFQLRQYQSMIVAEFNAQGDMRQSSRSGFSALADYIFGNNSVRSNIEMTAPVMRESSQKIAMTAPVMREQNRDEQWTIAFVMPQKWTLQTLPRPNNGAVSLRAVPERLMATVQFSGRGGEASYRDHQNQLERWIEKQGWVVNGSPLYAGYDPPWTLPPFRRHEVMIPVMYAN